VCLDSRRVCRFAGSIGFHPRATRYILYILYLLYLSPPRYPPLIVAKKMKECFSGMIGHCWATLFLSAGYDVCMYDISQERVDAAMHAVETKLRKLKVCAAVCCGNAVDPSRSLCRMKVCCAARYLSKSNLPISAALLTFGTALQAPFMLKYTHFHLGLPTLLLAVEYSYFGGIPYY
jgi:hypothetical protein